VGAGSGESADIQACVNLPEKIRATAGFAKACGTKFSAVREVILSGTPSLLKGLLGAGFAKSVCKI
jgi:hypothetical protein